MEVFIKKLYLKLLFLIIFNVNLFAEDIENLFDDVNNYTKNNNINIEYQPSAMTVLYAEDLEVLGITTLSEALDFVPGIQTYSSPSFTSSVSVRGFSQPLNVFQDKIKYKINGVSVSSNYFENFSISLIERIEISKGSASTTYSERGFVAIVNIITKSSLANRNSITLGTGSFDRRNFALSLNEKLDDSWNIGFDLYYLKHNKTVDAPSAILTNSEYFGTTFDRKKESLEGKEDLGLGLFLENDNFKISSRYINNYKQNNYGFTGFLDFNDEGYSEYKTFSNEISYDTFITQNNTIETKLGMLQNNYKLNTYLYKFEPNNLGIYDPHFKVDYTQRENYLSIVLKNRSFTNHEIDYGVYSSIVSIPKNNYYANVDSLYKFGLYIPSYNSYFPIQKELKKFSGKDGFLSNTDSREIFSYFISDKYNITENLSFLFNISIDDYELYEKQRNFKVGTVYSNDDINIYKFILSETNRTPSLIESSIVGHMLISENSDLEAEKMQSAEWMYIYQQINEKFKLNIFYSKYINAIDGRAKDNILQYYNKTEDDNNYGIELEYIRNFENRSKLLLNGSYDIFEYKNKDNFNLDINTPAVSKSTINLGYIYPLSSKVTLSSLAKYYGSKELLGDNNPIPDVILFDMGMQYSFTKNAKISLNIKNILDKDYYYWGYNTTNEKMLREGRTWYTSLSYEF